MSCNNDGEEAALRLAGELFAFLKREELKLRSDFFSDDKGIFIKRTKRYGIYRLCFFFWKYFMLNLSLFFKDVHFRKFLEAKKH